MGKALADKTAAEIGELFPIHLVAPTANWRAVFEAESRLIADTLKALGSFTLHHIGSTAIPGICAKPTIDMILEIASADDLQSLVESLASIGYSYVPEPTAGPAQAVFYKGYSEDGSSGQTFHLHARPADQPHRELVFRDYLNVHPQTAAEYEALKLELAKRYRTDRDAYTDSKTAFIEDVLKKAAAAKAERL
jgi:GrpB-like predicted nucleotidyltransferase (UPF0157 family)